MAAVRSAVTSCRAMPTGCASPAARSAPHLGKRGHQAAVRARDRPRRGVARRRPRQHTGDARGHAGSRRSSGSGPAEPAQSLDRIDRFYRASLGRSTEERSRSPRRACTTLSPSVVAWLERRVASEDSDELRGDAAEWIAWHPIEASSARARSHRPDRPQLSRAPGSRRSDRRSRDAGGGAGADRARALAHGSRRAARSGRSARGASEPAARDALASIARQDADARHPARGRRDARRFRGPRGVPLLIELARTHPNVDVRREAIETLGDAMPPETALPLLEKLVMTRIRGSEIRRQAVERLMADSLSGASGGRP